MKTKKEKTDSFFSEAINQSIARHQIEVSTEARDYVASMLTRFAYDLGLYQETWLTPITFQYQRITEETSRLQRTQLRRELGDHCLFLVGYFYDFVRQHGKGQVRYHTQVGSAAYQQIGKFPFVEIGEKFNELYLVIGDLRLPNIDDEKTVELYQKWMETGDKYYESLLLGKGLIPTEIKARNN